MLYLIIGLIILIILLCINYTTSDYTVEEFKKEMMEHYDKKRFKDYIEKENGWS